MDPKTRVFQTADGENLVTLACIIFDRSTRVTDRRTDGWMLMILSTSHQVPSIPYEILN